MVSVSEYKKEIKTQLKNEANLAGHEYLLHNQNRALHSMVMHQAALKEVSFIISMFTEKESAHAIVAKLAAISEAIDEILEEWV